MSRQAVVDWNAIFSDYLKGFWEIKGSLRVHRQPTLEELAKKYNIASSTIRNHASENNWKQKRQHYQATLGSDRGYFAQISAEMASDVLATARLLLGNLKREIEEVEQGKLPKNLRTDIAQRRLNNAKTLQTLQNIVNGAIKAELVEFKEKEINNVRGLDREARRKEIDRLYKTLQLQQKAQRV